MDERSVAAFLPKTAANQELVTVSPECVGWLMVQRRSGRVSNRTWHPASLVC